MYCRASGSGVCGAGFCLPAVSLSPARLICFNKPYGVLSQFTAEGRWRGLKGFIDITGARYTTTTEVYPDSPRATPEQCIAAQVAAVCAGLDFVCPP